MKALSPHTDGWTVRGGVRLHYEVYGEGDTTVLLLPTWAIFHARHWKMQIPYLARRHRVVTFDGRGNGGSDRPAVDDAYGDDTQVADAVAVLDATETRRCVAVGLSLGAKWALLLAAAQPQRVEGVVAVAPAVPLGQTSPNRRAIRWNDPIADPQGWEKHNRHHWLRAYEDWATFFVDQIFTEPHSTKAREDGVGWALETDGATLVRTYLSPRLDEATFRKRLADVRRPVLVIHGSHDEVVPHATGAELARATRGELLTFVGSGHAPTLRDPVRANLAVAGFVDGLSRRATEPRSWTRGRVRPPRVLYVSSPIGLGHARRDLAIARELKRRRPGLQVDWLAQPPVTSVLGAAGERIHPASRRAASEVAHVDRESGEHRLHCFQTIRRMDEILLANFMLFLDVVREAPYDLIVADEAWEIDYYLHENPELKTFAYAWLTDFVGWLPMPSGGAEEAAITADDNEEMIRHVERYPRVRDRAIFVGDPEDIVPDAFGPDLPGIREWTEAHFEFGGYVTGFDPGELGDRPALRRELGYHGDETVCLVSVGGSGVGLPLLRKVASAFPAVREAIPNLRMVLVAGPRIDPSLLPRHHGLEVRPYVDRLHRHLAAADVAIVQGGLTTCMELAAAKRPFVFVPLIDHFEQNFHVRARLARYGAGRHLAFDAVTPERLATVLTEELHRDAPVRDVDPDRAAHVGQRIAELL